MLDKMEPTDFGKVIEKFEEMTKDAENVQRETLKKLLEENGSAEYLQNLGLNGRTDPASFKACVPLVTHKEMEPYIQRIADGENLPILTGKPITTISLSSGTSQGKPKFVPFTNELMESTLEIYRTSFAYRNRDYPLGNGRALQFIYGSKQFKTKGGLLAGTATTNVYRSPSFKNGMREIHSQGCSPDEVIFGPDFHQSLYCHLLCGLIFREEVQFVFSTFAHSIVNAFRSFEQVWEELCTDIREGVLSSRVTHPSIRAAMEKLLKPNPEEANEIYTKCSNLSNWYCLIPELFPNAKYIYGIMTGSMEPYLLKLRHYAGNLPLISHDYGSSEGWVGANINPTLPPELVTYVVLPHIGYYEFIPLSNNGKHPGHDSNNPASLSVEPDPVGLTEVKDGEEYEIVITSVAGFYRYRLGDVVKVMGFHNNTPKLSYVRRSNLVLTINIDKTTERDLQLAVETAGKILSADKLDIIDFTSIVDLSAEPGHYVLYWEISGEGSDEVLQQCCNSLDRSFIKDAGYGGSRKVNAIAPLELRVLQRGTIQKIMSHYVGLGGAVSQFKMPRCIGPANRSVLEILSENVAKSYFSTVY